MFGIMFSLSVISGKPSVFFLLFSSIFLPLFSLKSCCFHVFPLLLFLVSLLLFYLFPYLLCYLGPFSLLILLRESFSFVHFLFSASSLLCFYLFYLCTLFLLSPLYALWCFYLVHGLVISQPVLQRSEIPNKKKMKKEKRKKRKRKEKTRQDRKKKKEH